jgi:UDP-N-acetylmuramoyl-tripeptide--D-alanyl-D-alanine ligase
MTVLLLAGWLVLIGLNGVRWLRVAQREHYEPGRVTRIAWRWGLLGFGLPFRGTRPGPLAWTRRLRTVATVSAVLVLALLPLLGPLLLLVLAPLVVDLALFILAPIENALAGRWVRRAAARLASVRPTVVAITGSYGKTSTKGYVAHLIAPARSVVATPGSFNNRAGLARAINEHLAPGTEVFIAEMGTYGPGEIRALCAWVPPKIAAITAIGPVHLERCRSEDRIVTAKAEILEAAEVAVLNVDDARLADLALKVTTRVVGTRATDLLVDLAPATAAPTNVAVALAIARELGVADEVLAAQLPSLPVAEHRLTQSTSPSGFTILDDTFNANPAGTRRALEALARQPVADGGRRVVVTPGMYELGPRQVEENKAFATAAAAIATHVIVVGRTNRTALARAAREGAEVVTVPTREKAVAWVRENLGPGDVVLYVNDQPDHYP